MSQIGTVRQAVADIVGDATSIPSYVFVPGRFIVPAVVVMPGSPYIETGNTYGSVLVRFQIELVMGTAANEVSSGGLDDQIENALTALIDEGYSIENVSQPYAMEANGQQYLSATITINQTIRP